MEISKSSCLEPDFDTIGRFLEEIGFKMAGVALAQNVGMHVTRYLWDRVREEAVELLVRAVSHTAPPGRVKVLPDPP